MKTLPGIITLAVLVLTLGGPAQAGSKSPDKSPHKKEHSEATKEKQMDSLQKKIDVMAEDLRLLDLRMNKFVYETYLEYMKDRFNPIPITKLKTFDLEKLCDTVPEIARLNSEYKAADEKTKAVLMKDPDYQALQKRKKAGDFPGYSVEFSQIYSRLMDNDAEYRDARLMTSAALNARNIAIARYLLNDCQRRGDVMPTSGVITKNEMQFITDLQAYKNMAQDRWLINTIMSGVKTELVNMKYEMPAQ